jgi:hypothetical protein
MRPVYFALALSSMLAGGPRMAQETAIPEPIVLDSFPIAFYEIAPRKLAASMRRAVVAECGRPGGSSVDSRVTKARMWLCDKTDDTFLRAADTQGRGMVIGYVCEGDWGLKYVATVVVSNAEDRVECVAMSYGSTTEAHTLELQPRGRSSTLSHSRLTSSCSGP